MQIEKMNYKRNLFKRIFPNLTFDIAMSIALISTVVFASSLRSTANIGQELALMYMPIDEPIEVVEESIPILEAEFEIFHDEIAETAQTVEYQTSQMCFIGGTRTVGMQNAVLTNAYFIAKEAKGLTWFNSSATSEFKKIKNNVEICVVELGISDMWLADSYVEKLNVFAEQYPEKIFIYINIGPVDEEQHAGVLNCDIEEFNDKLLHGLSNRWQIVDLYSYVYEEGFASDDGLNYSNQDYAKIYAWIVDSIKTQIVNVE